MSNILANVEQVRQKIAAAAARAGRNPADVTLIAVSKTRTVDEIRQVLAAGITDLGENRIQELKDKWPDIGRNATWHLIGSLQTNKVKPALEMADLIHSLDRDSLADELIRQAGRRGVPCHVLVQVNVSGEESKHGIAPAELPGFLRRCSESGILLVQGLMTMAPLDAEPEAARPHFRRLRELAREVRELALPNVTIRHLSMGMSGDYEVAIEEGATLVRVGTAIFGTRPSTHL
ncbi:MAG TPA: YggS family pyridoxal phosphate-dependent enzyme, partial [Symbiobacteriaceae bacterium]|nr:YggS family pyridoxal phosphate-dependent enzyme [Symbiobacteriaceae bacterium]